MDFQEYLMIFAVAVMMKVAFYSPVYKKPESAFPQLKGVAPTLLEDVNIERLSSGKITISGDYITQL